MKKITKKQMLNWFNKHLPNYPKYEIDELITG